MNKKGFTLIEVIVSVVLVSVVLTSMLASLVKLKTSYEVVSENTDALVFSSSLARIINNDFTNNGGIRYIDCTYYGDVCDITLNNNEKRRIQIKTAQSGLTWAQHYNQTSKPATEFFKNIVVNVVVENGTSKNEKYYSLSDFYSNPSIEYASDVKELIVEGENSLFKSQYCEKIDTGLSSYLSGLCEVTVKDGSVKAACECTKQEVSTSLIYSDVSGDIDNNIYVKTLSYVKEQDLYTKNLDGTFGPSTGKVRTSGYNFGKLSYTNMSYDNTSRKDDPRKQTEESKFVDSISFTCISSLFSLYK